MKAAGLRRCITWIGLCLVLWSSLAPAYLPSLVGKAGAPGDGNRSAIAASLFGADDVCHSATADSDEAARGDAPPPPEHRCSTCLMQACGGLLTLALSRLPELPAPPMQHVLLLRVQESLPLSPLMRGLALSRGPPAAHPLATPPIPADLRA
jgi:hypothetical protein